VFQKIPQPDRPSTGTIPKQKQSSDAATIPSIVAFVSCRSPHRQIGGPEASYVRLPMEGPKRRR